MTAAIYHLALRGDWDEAMAEGSYRRSTLGRSLEDEGFIHCSFADQVQLIADLVYRGRDDVVLLEIDPDRVEDEIRVEQVGGAPQPFPHIYGPLPIDAVVRVRELQCGPDGRLEMHCPVLGTVPGCPTTRSPHPSRKRSTARSGWSGKT